MRFARIILLFLAIELFLGNLGLLGKSLDALGSAVLVIIFFGLSFPAKDFRFKRLHLLPAAAFAMALFVIIRGGPEEIFVFPMLVASLLLFPKRDDQREGEREVLAIAVFVYAFIVIAELHVPLVWHLFHGWGLGFSKVAGEIIRQKYLFGPTAAGLPILLLFLSYHASLAICGKERRWRYFLTSVACLVLLQAAVILLLTPLAILIQWRFAAWQLLLMNPEILYFIAFLPTLVRRAPEPVSPRPGRLALALGLGALSAALAFGVTLRQNPGAPGGKVLIYNKGYLNLNVPAYGFYGYRSGGMFGYLPKFLDSVGFRVEITDTITTEKLSDADALVLINILDYFTQPEKDAMYGFVKRGGGLLALGDHTGVMGIRGPYNDLLAPFGIEFLFDSASFILKGWKEEGFAYPHAITHGLVRPDEMEIWVGASLGIRPPARPIFIGKYGYSDWGDIRAIDKAYLGNRLFDAGEQLGDMVLVAAAEYGKGKVLVYGDTSTYQNLSMVTGHRVIMRVFSWLTSGSNTGWLRPLCMIFIFAIAVLAVARRDTLLIGAAACGIFVGAAVGLAPRTMGKDFTSSLPTAMIDVSHFERFNRQTWFAEDIGGLQYNLMRAGYLPFMTETFSEKSLMSSRLLVVIAPVKPFRAGEAAAMDAFMEQGGWILYSCGTEEKDGSRRFLERQGLELLDVPLAAFVDTVGGLSVQVQEGWGIGVRNPGATVIAARYGFPYVVSVRKGNGGLILIADSYFLVNRNLEGMEEFYEGNINFLRRLLDGIKGVKR